MSKWQQFGLRSPLFVPGDRARELFPKALRSGADAIILDLEDAVLKEAKERARGIVTEIAARSTKRPVLVRVNAPGTEWLPGDLASPFVRNVSGIVLPKVESEKQVDSAADSTDRAVRFVAMIESAAGVLRVAEIARSPHVVGLGFGAEDFSADIGATRTGSGVEALYAQSRVIVAAAAFEKWAIDSPTLELVDELVITRDARRAKRLGFVGKFALHPRQVGPLMEGFRPSPQEVEAAAGILKASADAAALLHGVTRHENRMIDAPVIAQARRVLAQAADDEIPEKETSE